MSKMDGLRAMREAKYAQAKARGATTGAKPTVARKVTPKPAATEPAEAEADAEAAEARCGHRAISGRTCTREHGHEAKSHRYS
jgi:hypothetical protein